VFVRVHPWAILFSVIVKYLALNFGLWASVEEQADFIVRGVEIIEQLRLVLLEQGAHHFELDDDEVVYDQISVELAYDLAVIVHAERLLADNLKLQFAQLDGQGVLVYLFQESVAESIVDTVEPL
jgi:hypothetical protein